MGLHQKQFLIHSSSLTYHRRRVSYPTRYQERYYNAKYHYHGIKLQGMVSPVGILESVFGPLPSIRNDAAMWSLARDFSPMDRINTAVGRHCFALGDPAYRGHHMHNYIATSFSRFQPGGLTREQAAYNGSLARARVVIEWMFGRVYTLWRRLQFVPRMQVCATPLGKMYLVCAILTNVHTCLNGGNQVSFYFGGIPPTLDEYLAAPRPQHRTSRAHAFYERAQEIFDDMYG